MDMLQPGMTEIMRAVSQLQGGDRAGARALLLQLWEHWSTGRAPAQQSVIAHFLADTEEAPEAELAWDLLSLKAATGSHEAERRSAAIASLASFLPSIHLNVGDAYRRVGDMGRAGLHAELGSLHLEALESGGYRDMVAGALERLSSRIRAPAVQPPSAG